MAISCIFADGFEESVSTTQTLFRSLGTDATGTLNAWTIISGAPSISSNLVSVPSGAILSAGHPDWGDCTETIRFIWATGGTATLAAHTTGPGNYVRFGADGVHIFLAGVISGTFPAALSTVGVPLVNGTAYWLRLSCNGTTYRGSIFADAAGSIGTLIAQTAAVTITDPILQTGPMSINSNAATIQFGGAFANVCTVTGPIPAGWNTFFGGGEPALCWSKASSSSGSYSLSVYSGHMSAYGGWTRSLGAVVSGQLYTASVSVRGPVTGPYTGNVYLSGGADNFNSSWGTTGAWTQQAMAFTPTGNETLSVILRVGAGGAPTTGTYYWDDFSLYSGTMPAQPTFTKSGGKYVATFGGQALPNGQGILTPIDLNDRVNAFAFFGGGVESDDDNVQRGFTQVPYLAKGLWTYDDFGQRALAIPSYYLEDGSHFLGQFLAALSQAGEQRLTFDGATYIPAKYAGTAGRKEYVTGGRWFYKLLFAARAPWFQDIAASTLAAQPLGTDSGTCFGVLNPGSVFCEPVWTLDIPATNAVAINSFQLQNTMSGESLTVNFLSRAALTASTHWIITIDCAKMTATDQNGNAYDVSSSFPMLYGPAGLINPFTTVVTPASGSSSGLTLAASYQSRWQI